MAIFFKRIKDLREDKDYTQTKFAKMIGIPRQTYSMYENGFNNIPLETFDLIARTLGVSIDYLTGKTDIKTYKQSQEMNFNLLCQNLKNLRLSQGKNQQEFADILGISQQAWSYYEHGQKRISSSNLYQLSVITHSSMDFLLGKIPTQPKM